MKHPLPLDERLGVGEASEQLPINLPTQRAPDKPKGTRCRFCRKAIPAEQEGAVAWRICEDCWYDTEFAA